MQLKAFIKFKGQRKTAKYGQETVEHNSAAEFLPPSVPPQEKTNKHTSAAVNQGPLRSAALSLSHYYRIIATMLPNMSFTFYLEQVRVFFTLCVCVCVQIHTHAQA